MRIRLRRAPAPFKPELISCYLYHWAVAQDKWNNQMLPALRREAERRGCDLEITRDVKSASIPGYGKIPYAWDFSCRFKRRPTPSRQTVPKSQRPLCGAQCRTGQPCRARVVVSADGKLRRRCRLHGGLSTGPKSAEGRAAIAESNRQRALKKGD